MNSYIFTSGGISIFVDGQPLTVASDHPNYKSILTACTQEDWNKAKRLADIEADVKQFVKQAEDQDVKIEHGVVTFRGEQVPSLIGRRIRQLYDSGLSIDPLVNFLRNLYDNPSRTAVRETYDLLEFGNLPITPDGHFLAYKRVREDYTSVYDSKTDNSIGTVLRMERRDVDDDRDRTCSYGLHFCSYDYIKHFQGARIVVLKVNPRDVVSIPSDYNNTKGRACQYEVVGEIDLHDTVQEGKCRWDSTPVVEYVDQKEVRPVSRKADAIKSEDPLDWFDEGCGEALLAMDTSKVITEDVRNDVILRGFRILSKMKSEHVDGLIELASIGAYNQERNWEQIKQDYNLHLLDHTGAFAIGYVAFQLSSLQEWQGLFEVDASSFDKIKQIFQKGGDNDTQFMIAAQLDVTDASSLVDILSNADATLPAASETIRAAQDWIDGYLQPIVTSFLRAECEVEVLLNVEGSLEAAANVLQRHRIKCHSSTDSYKQMEMLLLAAAADAGDLTAEIIGELRIYTTAVCYIILCTEQIEQVDDSLYDSVQSLYFLAEVMVDIWGKTKNRGTEMITRVLQLDDGLNDPDAVDDILYAYNRKSDMTEVEMSVLRTCVSIIMYDCYGDMTSSADAEQIIDNYFNCAHNGDKGLTIVDDNIIPTDHHIVHQTNMFQIGVDAARQARRDGEIDVNVEGIIQDGVEVLTSVIVQLYASSEVAPKKEKVEHKTWEVSEESKLAAMCVALGFIIQVGYKFDIIEPLFLDRDSQEEVMALLRNPNETKVQMIQDHCSQQIMARIARLMATIKFYEGLGCKGVDEVSSQVNGPLHIVNNHGIASVALNDVDVEHVFCVGTASYQMSNGVKLWTNACRNQGIGAVIAAIMSDVDRGVGNHQADTFQLLDFETQLELLDEGAHFCYDRVVRMRDFSYDEGRRHGRRRTSGLSAPMLSVYALGHEVGRAHKKNIVW